LNSKLILAKWTDRFLAWIIDFILISTILTAIIFLTFGTIYYELDDGGFWAENTQYIPASALFLIYWIVSEYKTGQSVGKKILNLKIVSLDGKKPSLKGIILSSFGKSFLLPIDVLLGWILTNQKRQRIFNKLGDTVIIKIKETGDNSSTTYLKD
jgi:uncharacterized RDD family membrane protein YckC